MEKRGNNRTHKRLSVRFGVDAPTHPGFTRDISPTGAFIVCSLMPPLGTRLQMQFMTAPNQWEPRAGIVRRLRHVPEELRRVQQSGFAVSFVAEDQPPAPVAEPAPAVASTPGVFEAHFRSTEALQEAWRRELHLGGLLILGEASATLDQRVAVHLYLDFAPCMLELPARVVQLVTVPVRGVAVAFEDLQGLRHELAPYLPQG